MTEYTLTQPVQAFKIDAIEVGKGSEVTLRAAAPSTDSAVVSTMWAKRAIVVGAPGYYVQYAGGFMAWVPVAEFEACFEPTGGK